MHIDSYSFGVMTVNGKVYKADLIVFPDKILPNWWRKEGHSLAVEDLKEMLDYKPEILIVGKGAMSGMHIPQTTKKFLETSDIELIEANTEQATRLFNKSIGEGKRAVGAFHLTC